MLSCLMYRPCPKSGRRRYYRVELSYNLFEEISVLREWGLAGGRGASRIDIYGSLRLASEAADRVRNATLKRGYSRAA
ncbi:WGR domain-containing protein [Thalassobius sp. S69A]|uniref:WGR domain-containing protein n=1 Tax=unclassified Thalassovita TaxID=2619711 RepID=UPI000C0E4CD5|nr:hypothetical protein [Paracoccaceae bacterium]MBT25537.1 hypothetical protein [Paracoccaceae bacterium]